MADNSSKDITGVELHVHLDGCLTADLLCEVLSKNGVEVPDISREELHRKISVLGRCEDLAECLAPFFYFTPLIAGNLDVITDLAQAFVKRQHDSKVFYTEVRYSPQILSSAETGASTEQVVQAVSEGLRRGQEEFPGTYVRQLLCVMRHLPPEHGFEVVDLVKKYAGKGVVGIDLAGDEGGFKNELFTDVFAKAKEYGLNITIHAGEAGGHDSVTSALDSLHAQRIGHGYHCIDCDNVYKRVNEQRVCLEVCPTSAWRTAAVSDDWTQHPLRNFIRDGLNWVIGSDDPGLFDFTYRDEMIFSQKEFNISEADMNASLMRGLESCFLPDNEKQTLLAELRSRLS